MFQLGGELGFPVATGLPGVHRAPKNLFPECNTTTGTPPLQSDSTSEAEVSDVTEDKPAGHSYLILVPSWKAELCQSATVQLLLFIVNDLKNEKKDASLLLTSKLESLPVQSRTTFLDIKAEIFEPEISEDLLNNDPSTNILHYCEECYGHIKEKLCRFTHIIAVNGRTSALAEFFMESRPTESNIKQVTLNIYDEDMTEVCEQTELLQTIKTFRSSSLVISIGKTATERWKTLIQERSFELDQKYVIVDGEKDEFVGNNAQLTKTAKRVILEIHASM